MGLKINFYITLVTKPNLGLKLVTLSCVYTNMFFFLPSPSHYCDRP